MSKKISPNAWIALGSVSREDSDAADALLVKLPVQSLCLDLIKLKSSSYVFPKAFHLWSCECTTRMRPKKKNLPLSGFSGWRPPLSLLHSPGKAALTSKAALRGCCSLLRQLAQPGNASPPAEANPTDVKSLPIPPLPRGTRCRPSMSPHGVPTGKIQDEVLILRPASHIFCAPLPPAAVRANTKARTKGGIQLLCFGNAGWKNKTERNSFVSKGCAFSCEQLPCGCW